LFAGPFLFHVPVNVADKTRNMLPPQKKAKSRERTWGSAVGAFRELSTVLCAPNTTWRLLEGLENITEDTLAEREVSQDNEVPPAEDGALPF
jgi:hypothetical protein